MANFIDIKEFDGVLTNVDIEDLPDNVAQEIKNLKIQAGKLEKTFGAGTASGIPSIGLTFVNASYSPTKAYTVHNIFTFVSDKFEGDLNDAGDGYRYLLVTVEATDQTVILWWWDSSLPDVTDHLQVEDDIVWFQTATAHGITEDDQVLVQDIKNNASPQASITSGSPATPIGVYKSADIIPSTTKVGINTDTAQTWGGSFFSNTLATGASAQSFGGKHNTHLLVSDTVSYGGTAQNKIVDIAIASMNGMALSLMIVDNTDNVDYFLYKFNISKKDKKRIKFIDNFYKEKINSKTFTENNMNKIFYYHGKEITLDILNYRKIKSKKIDDTLNQLIQHYEILEMPVLPVSAKFLMEKYEFSEGKQLGEKLKIIEEEWVKNNFKISDNQVENIVKN